jgi:hypothetical protein
VRIKRESGDAQQSRSYRRWALAFRPVGISRPLDQGFPLAMAKLFKTRELTPLSETAPSLCGKVAYSRRARTRFACFTVIVIFCDTVGAGVRLVVEVAEEAGRVLTGGEPVITVSGLAAASTDAGRRSGWRTASLRR